MQVKFNAIITKIIQRSSYVNDDFEMSQKLKQLDDNRINKSFQRRTNIYKEKVEKIKIS
jgi:hypothetical protein